MKDFEFCKTFTIVCRGCTEEDIDDAFAEAIRKLQQGYTSGADRSELGEYNFSTSYEVPTGERP